MTPIDQPVPDLLPCPFCGGGDTVFNDITLGSTQVLKVRLIHHCGADDWPCVEFSGRTKADCIAAWNRRSRPSMSGMRVTEEMARAFQARWREEKADEDADGFMPSVALITRLLIAALTPDPAAGADEAEANAPALPSQPEGEVGEKLLADLEALLSHIDDKGYMLRRQWTPELRERVWAMFDRFAALRAQPKGEAVAWAWTMRLPMGSFVEGANGPERVHKTKRCVTLFKPPSDDPDVSDVVALGPLADAPAEVDKLREALGEVIPLLTLAGNVAYNMKQTTSTVESAREFERINGWVDSAKAIARAALT